MDTSEHTHQICLWTHGRVWGNPGAVLPQALREGLGHDPQVVLASKAHTRPGLHLLRPLRAQLFAGLAPHQGKPDKSLDSGSER